MITNLSNLLFQHLPSKANKVAIYYEGDTITYGQLGDQANRLGNGLKNLKITPKSSVIILLHDKPAYVATFFGGLKAGYVMVLANTNLQPDSYKFLLNDTQAKCLVVDAILYSKIEPIRAYCPALEHVIVVGAEHTNTHSYEKIVQEASPDLDFFPWEENDPAFVLYTSGTTDTPKGVVHRHQDAHFAYEGFGKQILKIQPEDTICSLSKMFFAYGFGNSIIFPFSVGATLQIPPAWATPEAMFDFIEKQKPTLLCAIPSFYNAMLHVPDAEKRNLNSLRMCISAGEKLPKTVFEAWKKAFGFEIIEGVGSSEMLHIYISQLPSKVNPDAVGLTVPGFEIKLVNAQGQEVVVDEPGVMMVKGQSASTHYLNKPEQTQFSMRDGWIYTNDQFKKDREGYFYFIGRNDDLFKITGLWVSPLEVEHFLLEHPSVKECLVSPSIDASNLVTIKARIVLKKDTVPSDDLKKNLQRFLKSKLLPHKIPQTYEFVDNLPKSSTGKLIRPKNILY